MGSMIFVAETVNSDLAWSFIGLVVGWPLGFFLGYSVGTRRARHTK